MKSVCVGGVAWCGPNLKRSRTLKNTTVEDSSTKAQNWEDLSRNPCTDGGWRKCTPWRWLSNVWPTQVSFKHNFCNSTGGTARTERQNVCLRNEIHFTSCAHTSSEVDMIFCEQNARKFEAFWDNKNDTTETANGTFKLPTSNFSGSVLKILTATHGSLNARNRTFPRFFIFVAITKSGFQRCIK